MYRIRVISVASDRVVKGDALAATRADAGIFCAERRAAERIRAAGTKHLKGTPQIPLCSGEKSTVRPRSHLVASELRTEGSVPAYRASQM